LCGSVTKLSAGGKQLSGEWGAGEKGAKQPEKTNYSLPKPVVCATCRGQLFCFSVSFRMTNRLHGFLKR